MTMMRLLCKVFGLAHGAWSADVNPNPKVIDTKRICRRCGVRYDGVVWPNPHWTPSDKRPV